MFIKTIYIKKFTNILGFIQKEKIIQYDLCKTHKNGDKNILSYGIKLRATGESTYEEDKLLDISTDKNLVENIIRYLYENAIDITNFKDVIHDVMFRIDQNNYGIDDATEEQDKYVHHISYMKD